MKKTLAIVLSFVMVLALCAGMFSFAAEKGYAETEADKLWAAATTVKSTKVLITVNGAKLYLEGETAETSLATLAGSEFTGTLAGSVAFKDGVLTLTSVKCTVDKEGVATDTRFAITSDASLKIVLKGDKGSTAYLKCQNNGDFTDKAGTKTTKAAGTHLIYTSDDGVIVKGADNTGRSKGSIIVYGNIGFQINCGKGYDAFIIDAGSATEAAPANLIIGNSVPSTACGSNQATIENRSGNIIFCDNADWTVNHTGTTVEGGTLDTAGRDSAILIRKEAPAGSKVIFRDSVKIVATATARGAVAACPQVDYTAPVADGIDVSGLAEGSTIKVNGTAATAITGAATELKVEITPKPVEVPETSDASVAAIAVVALISVAAAVVVLRKRVNG